MPSLHNSTPPALTLHQSPSPTMNTSQYDTMQKFLNLIGTEHLIHVLLQCDRNNQVIDKWLAAIVFEYFNRAKLLPHQFTREKFFIALYLAIEFEEDEDRKVKDVLLDYLLHQDNIWTGKRQFVKKKDKFWKKLGFRCMVGRRRLEQIISIDPYHSIWQRERKEGLAGANRSFTVKLDPPSFYKFNWPAQHTPRPGDGPRAPPKIPEVIDLTQDSPPVPIAPHERRRKSAAYRHLNSIVTLIAKDRNRRRAPHDILKMKHVEQKRLNELQMLEHLARSNTFQALGSELAHLNMNAGLTAPMTGIHGSTLYNNNYQLLYNSVEGQDYNLPGLILLPDRRVSFPMFNLDLSNGTSPNLPMVVPVIPRNDHWV